MIIRTISGLLEGTSTVCKQAFVDFIYAALGVIGLLSGTDSDGLFSVIRPNSKHPSKKWGKLPFNFAGSSPSLPGPKGSKQSAKWVIADFRSPLPI